VFIGSVDESEFTDEARTARRAIFPERWIFEVDEVDRGEVYAHQSVVSPSGCGVNAINAGPHLVIATTSKDIEGTLDGELYSDLCFGTRPLELGPPDPSAGIASPPIPGESACRLAVAAGADRDDCARGDDTAVETTPAPVGTTAPSQPATTVISPAPGSTDDSSASATLIAAGALVGAAVAAVAALMWRRARR
jgi:hypothetical protein